MNYKYFPFFKEDVFSIFSDLWYLQCHWPVFVDKGSQETRQLYSSLIWSCPRYWHHTITIMAPTYISTWIMMNYYIETIFWFYTRSYKHAITIMAPAYIMAQMLSIILPMLKTILRDSIFRPKGRTGMNIAIHASKIQNIGRIVPNRYYPNNIAFALTTGFPKICQCQKVSECQIFRARKWWLVGGHKCKLET